MAIINLLNIEEINFIVEGAKVTFNLTFYSFLIGLAFGVFIYELKISRYKILQILSTIYISVFRGTPVLVQLSIFYFALPLMLNIKINAFQAGILTFSLNSAAYIAEIIRSGVNSVNIGQFEAAKALNIPYGLMMGRIIFPQAFKVVLPSLVNEFVNLLKETAIISFIGVHDIMKRAQIISAEKYIYFEPLMIAAICYYIMVVIFSSIAKYIEYKLK